MSIQSEDDTAEDIPETGVELISNSLLASKNNDDRHLAETTILPRGMPTNPQIVTLCNSNITSRPNPSPGYETEMHVRAESPFGSKRGRNLQKN